MTVTSYTLRILWRSSFSEGSTWKSLDSWLNWSHLSGAIIDFDAISCIHGVQLFIQLNLRERHISRMFWRNDMLRRVINIGDRVHNGNSSRMTILRSGTRISCTLVFMIKEIYFYLRSLIFLFEKNQFYTQEERDLIAWEHFEIFSCLWISEQHGCLKYVETSEISSI